MQVAIAATSKPSYCVLDATAGRKSSSSFRVIVIAQFFVANQQYWHFTITEQCLHWQQLLN